MKAFLCHNYGPPSKLKLEDIPVPTLKPDEVLVKIAATTINDFDWSLVTGKPGIYRLLFGITKPKTPVPGIELAGIVESVGNEVTEFKEGDRVYGDISEFGWGTYAEYACVKQKSIVKIPEGMGFDEAVTISHASMLAYQGLVDYAGIKEGQKVLINGAGGGMGMFGLQIAKSMNCEVTGVDSGMKLETMKEIGFDHIIDYKQEDFTLRGVEYDIILDAKSTRPPKHIKRALKKDGYYATVGGDLGKIIRFALRTKFGAKNMQVVALKPNKDLDFIHDLYHQGKIKPIIDGPYAFEEIPRLIAYFGEGKHDGKVVVTVDGNMQ
ncbi:MAG: NAD(P)-dependent alcohol dehydrogenase [bacterium]|nr:NAD(P)-dependent alcohol dehydrogenase [bacterium]